jgi:signal transduction histidine kinase
MSASALVSRVRRQPLRQDDDLGARIVLGTSILTDLRQLGQLPLRRESIHYLALNPNAAEPPALNRLAAADPALALALLRLVPRTLREGKVGVPQLVRFATPAALLQLVQQTMIGPAGQWRQPNSITDQVWVHSLATAHAARALSRTRRYDHPQTAFLAGLLHNVGLLAVAAVAPDAIADLMAQKQSAGDPLAVETERLGAAHTGIGNQLSSRWSLPQWLQEVMCWHHQVATSMPEGLAHRALVELVHEADALVSQGEFGLGQAVDPRPWGLPWKNGDALSAAVSRGVRQATTFLQAHPLNKPAEATDTLLAHAVEMAGEIASHQAAHGWRNRAWDSRLALPADAAPAELTALVAETFAHALGALGSLCYVRNADGTLAEGAFWCDTARPLNCKLTPGDAKPHPDQVASQLRATWQQRPYRRIPLAAAEETIAEVLVWLDEFGPVPDAEAEQRAVALCTTWMAQAAHLARLESQLHTLAASLREQAAQATERIEHVKLGALAEMAAGAGHEINNPLAVISGRAQLLMVEESDPRRRKSLETIIAQAQRIHRMIVDLMMFARPPEPNLKPTAVTDVIDRAVAKVKADSADSEVAVEVAAAGSLCVEGDVDQLALAVECVVRNAIEASSPGSTVRVAASNAEGSRVGIRVTDTGGGISDDQRQHIFEPFYSGRDAGRGLGMGLSKAWRIVQNHRGEILIESQSGAGTTVTICLPGTAAEAAQRACA